MTDQGKEIIFMERRMEKASKVKIVFVDALNNFNVLDDEGKIKYMGIVKDKNPHIDDYCGCQSFFHGNSEVYVAEHGTAFQCKHILKAKHIRYWGYDS